MPKTSTSTPCSVVLGAKIVDSTLRIRIVNSDEERSVWRMGHSPFSAISAKSSVGVREWVKTQQGMGYVKSLDISSRRFSLASFWRKAFSPLPKIWILWKAKFSKNPPSSRPGLLISVTAISLIRPGLPPMHFRSSASFSRRSSCRRSSTRNFSFDCCAIIPSAYSSGAPASFLWWSLA